MQLPGSTLASRNCCRLSVLASSMTPSRARPRPLGGVEFYGCGEQHLAQRTAPRYAWFRAAQEGLIDLHIAGEPVPSWACPVRCSRRAARTCFLCPWAHCGRIWAHRVTVHRRGALYVLQSVV